jgi:thiol-disulfide isomerase/thioredoxin
MAQIVEVNNTADFQKTLNEVSQEQDFVIVYITGTTDPATGKNWCPDCERAKPNINNIVLANATGKVLKCIVQRSEWSGRSDHPYKQSALLKAKGVPTLLLLQGGQVVMRAERDEDFDNEELLMAIAKPE